MCGFSVTGFPDGGQADAPERSATGFQDDGFRQAGEHGHYGEPNGRCHLLNDLHTMNRILHERFPDTPIILYGHSMGSFYARWYAETWPESISGAIFSGTAGPHIRNQAGWAVAALTAAVRGPKYVSKTLVKLNMGA